MSEFLMVLASSRFLPMIMVVASDDLPLCVSQYELNYKGRRTTRLRNRSQTS